MTLQKSPAMARTTIAVVGGGFSGSVFALKALRDLPDAEIVLIERRRRLGRGLAYGACAPFHLLNVPVSRAEVGLEPRFADWLKEGGVELTAALAESGGDLGSAFVSRDVFGSYLEALMRKASAGRSRLKVVHAEAVRLEEAATRTVVLDDGRTVKAGHIVLATGNLPAGPLALPGLASDAAVANDPWMADALGGLDPSAPVLLVGTGLTMVDVVLKLVEDGHHGPLLALSRHGMLPATHAAGGSWAPFISAGHVSPLQALRSVRAAIAEAEAQNVPWQRVIDAARPATARTWHGWSGTERRQFLRHLRTLWTSVRHRMAPRVASRLQHLIASGQLRVVAGRIRRAEQYHDGLDITLGKQEAGQERFRAARVINCTGPRGDVAAIEHPLLADLVRKKLVLPDALGLGIETDDSAVLDSNGRIARGLFALGPLTRPAWWEITAIPEINTQIERLVQKLAMRHIDQPPRWSLLADEFVDLGAGI